MAKANKEPYLDREWIWFFPMKLAELKGLAKGNPTNDFYKTLRSIGIWEKSKKSGQTIDKAHRLDWKDFFESADELPIKHS